MNWKPASAVCHRAEGSDSDEQEKTVPPIKKLRQRVFGNWNSVQSGSRSRNTRLDEIFPSTRYIDCFGTTFS